MKYKFIDDAVFEANNFVELANQIWQSKFIPEPTIEEWMQASAARAVIYDGSVLRVGSVSEHIEDMIACGFLEKVE